MITSMFSSNLILYDLLTGVKTGGNCIKSFLFAKVQYPSLKTLYNIAFVNSER